MKRQYLKKKTVGEKLDVDQYENIKQDAMKTKGEQTYKKNMQEYDEIKDKYMESKGLKANQLK